MNKKIVISGLALIALCLGQAVAGNRYYETSRQHSDRYDDNIVETFYVEGRVVSATPVYETHWYYGSRDNSRYDRYRETCRIRDIEVHRSSSSAGPAGAIIGGAIGAHVGSHAGNSTESTIAGAIAGGVIGGLVGNEIDRDNTTVHYRRETECDTRYRHENRELIGYDVRYRYNGREFSIFTEQHPGRYIQLRVEVQPNVR
ncbi:MAG: glycine zipper domain-containing protein [Reinekea sp.]